MKIGEAIEGLRSFLRQMTAYPQIVRQLEAQLEAQQVWIDELEAELREERRWIPVGERLPEDNGRYLCNVKSFAFPGCFYQAILQCDKHGFREGNIYTDDVTHWMPLPEPPKEDS